MQNELEEFVQLLLEHHKEYVIHLSDPEDLYRFERGFQLLHERYKDRIVNGARLLLEE